MINHKNPINPLVSIVIINYNGLKYLPNILIECLASILTNSYQNLEILFIDNGSTDNSINFIKNHFNNDRRIKIISLYKNYGTSKAKNIGIMRSKGELILFLNNDIILEKDTLKKMVYTMFNRPELGILGCKLILPSKAIQSEGELFPKFSTLNLSKKHPQVWRRKNIQNIKKGEYLNIVDWVIGAVVLIKKETLLLLKSYDEDYYMLFEELDFAYRAKKAGYEVACMTNSSAIHYYEMTAKHFSEWKRKLYARNALLFIYKNYSNILFIRAITIYFISIFIKFLWGLIILNKYYINNGILLIKAFRYIKEPVCSPE